MIKYLNPDEREEIRNKFREIDEKTARDEPLKQLEIYQENETRVYEMKHKYEMSNLVKRQRSETQQLEKDREDKKYKINTRYFDKHNEIRTQGANEKALENEKKKYQKNVEDLDRNFDIVKTKITRFHSREIENLKNKHNEENSQLIAIHREAKNRLAEKKLDDHVNISIRVSNERNQQPQPQSGSNDKYWFSTFFGMTSDKKQQNYTKIRR